MSKQSGLGQRLFVGGFNVSGDIGSIDNAASPVATLDVTGIDKSAYERIGGLRDGALDYTAFFNPSDDQAHEVFSALPTSDVHELYCTGTALGDPAAGMLAKQINYDGKRGNDGSLTFTIQSQAAAGTPLEWGRLLTAAPRTDTTATNGSSYDFGAQSTAGLAAYLQVLGFTGTSCTVKLQESSDDGGSDTWADVTGGSFGAQSAVGTSRIQTSTSLTVERYLRVVTTGTFSSCAFAVLVVRY